MLDYLLYRNEKDRLCNEYSKLMRRAFKMALFNKEKSDKLNARAKGILAKLKRKGYKDSDSSF
jgi:hypothetical protein